MITTPNVQHLAKAHLLPALSRESNAPMGFVFRASLVPIRLPWRSVANKTDPWWLFESSI